ncbi:MAG TPA: 2-isopropylmalate synthase [Polyangiaceae bacterium]|nr:2-isopropylmalate synthase [Polyangiaceae bacterium]
MTAAQPYVAIFDTTLRDGEQSPGVSITLEEKLEIARALRDLHVDAIEAGFPAASLGVFEGVRAIARTIEGPMICALGRCVREDIDRAFEAVRDATRKRIHVFLATSPIHREHKLRMSREQILATVSDGVAYARSRWEDIEFSAEDACRTEPDFLVEVVERAILAGARTINIPDTVGYSVPTEIAAIFRHLRSAVRGIEGVTLSVHCHDDLGLAVANSFAAVEAGARQVACTINGLGERAGNCSLEEIVMAMITRRDYLGVSVGIQTRLLCPTSRLVSRITGFTVPPNKAVVGSNAFAHESGIHQHGVLANRATYEVMRPEDVGFGTSRLVLGKHSGRHALRRRLEQLGFNVREERLDDALAMVKRVAEHKKEIDDDDLRSILEGRAMLHWGP